MKTILLALLLMTNFIFAQNNNPGKGLYFLSDDKFDSLPTANSPFRGPGSQFPNYYDLTDLMPPVGSQGFQGSCVAWSTAYALRSYQEHIKKGGNNSRKYYEDISQLFSPAYVYNQINKGKDEGGYFEDALNLIKNQGCATLKTMPYIATDFISVPNDDAKKEAANYKISFWKKIEREDIKGLQEIKSQICSGYPVLVGVRIDKGFENGGYNIESGKKYIWNSFDGSETGGHAMVVVGYSDEFQAFKIQNSWGNNWGNNGFVWISYSFFPQCVKEAYVAKIMESDVIPPPVVISESEKYYLLYIEGIEALKSDEYNEAIKFFTEYINKGFINDSTFYFLGTAFYKKQENEKALLNFSKAIELNRYFYDAYKSRGIVRYIEGNYASAITDFDYAISGNNTDSESRYYRALSFLNSGNLQKAKDDLDNVLVKINNNPNIYYQRGLVLISMKNYDYAVKDFTNAINLNPNISMFYMKRGYANYKLGNYNDATKDYLEALKINPDNFDANKEIGITYYKDKNYIDAIRYLEKANRLDQTDFFVLFVLGNAYYETGKYKNAVECWDKSIIINPAIKDTIEEKLERARQIDF